MTATTAVTGSSSSRLKVGSSSVRLDTASRSPIVNWPGCVPSATSLNFATVIDTGCSSRLLRWYWPAAGFAAAQIHDRGIARRIHLDVDDRGTVPGGRGGKRGGELRLGADRHGGGAQRLRRAGVRNRPEVDRLGPALASWPLLDLDEAEGAVVEHHDRDAQPQPGGGLDL